MPIDGEQEVDDDRAQDRDDEDARSPRGRPSRRGPQTSDRGSSVQLLCRDQASNEATKPNEIIRSTRPIVQSAWFQGSPATVLPMSSVIWLVSVVIGCGQAGGHDRAVADDHLDRERLTGGAHHAQHHAVTMPVVAAGSTTWRIVCQRVVPRASEPVRMSRGTTSR